MKTINIKGKEYITVAERLKAFRNNFKDFRLLTEIVEFTPERCIMVAKVLDASGVEVANGHACETPNKNQINRLSILENCETSAIGRALGNFGIGIDEDICTADEMLLKQDKEDVFPETLKNAILQANNQQALNDIYKREFNNLTTAQQAEFVELCKNRKQELANANS